MCVSSELRENFMLTAGPRRPADDPWAHIFESIDEIDPRLPGPKLNMPSAVRARNQKMTAGEMNVFESMFDMIFAALDQQQQRNSVRPLGVGLEGAAIGSATGIEDVVDKIQSRKKNGFVSSRWTSANAQHLDRMKEEMELCDTDAALLTWARNHVFTEDVVNGSPSKLYPSLLALLMRAFRERFEDPHLALSVFEHARHLNIPSFVFGCTTSAYNELLTTRWTAFRDLRGVRDALEEMKVNGVPCNGQTRSLIENIRREVGERNTWLEDSLSNDAVLSLVKELDQLAAPTEEPHLARRTFRTGHWKGSDEWKHKMRDTMVPAEEDGLEDGMWSVNLFSDTGSSGWQQSPQRSALI